MKFSRLGPVTLAGLTLLGCSFLCTRLYAQATSATVGGQVTDPQGHVVAGAEIVFTNINTGVPSSTRTDGQGIYSLPTLQPGVYRANVTKEGFKGIVKPDIELHVQDQVSLNFALQVGSVSETITVSAGAPLVNTEDASVSTVVDRQFADNLPLNGRSFQSLIDLTPGVVVTPSGGYDNGQFSVNGQRTSSNYWMVDGVAANIGVPANTLFTGNGMAGSVGSFSAMGGTNSLVSVDDLQELRIQTSTYAPEFGRTPGAQISIVTRSGTDQWHGSVFDYFRNEALDANDWFADNAGLPRPPERQNDFGGTFGGPLLKGRTFFFFSYEGQRLKLPQVVETNVPCDATCKVGGDVRTAAQPVMRPYLNAFPLPNGPEVLCTASVNGCPASGTIYAAEFKSSYANTASLDAYSLRLDQKLKDKLSLFARYNYSPSNIITRGGNGEYAPAMSQVTPSQINVQTATAGVTWMLSPTASNDFRFNYSRVSTTSYNYLDNFGGAVPPSSYPIPSAYSLNNGQFGIEIYSLASPGYTAGENQSNLLRQLNLVNGFSLSRGAHNLKFGIDYRRLAPVSTAADYAQGAFFNDMPSTLAAPPELTDGYVVASFNTEALLFHNVGIYAQDTWHANSRLTLTYGLRWDIDFAPTSTNAYIPAAVTGYNATNLSKLALAGPGTRIFATDYSSLAPRIGVAYAFTRTPQWQSVVRGGFGVFYDLSDSEVGSLIVQGYPYSNTFYGGVVSFPLTASEAAPLSVVPPNSSQGYLDAFDPNLKSPYTLQWNFGVEQALGEQQALSLSYVAAHGSRLIQSADVSNPNANYVFAILVANTAASNYDALQAQFRRRLSRGLQALASYTWSHSLDDGSSGFGNDGDLFGAGVKSYGPSDFDIRQAFSAALTYDVPAARVPGFAKPVLAGWSVENIVQARSATPVDLTYGYLNQLHDGYYLDVRPDVVPGKPLYLSGTGCSILYLSECPGGRGFNPAAFTSPPLDSNGLPLREGDLGRNAMRAFGMAQWDFALHRDFPIHDAVKMQFRAEMFNVLNHPNFGPEQGNLGAPGELYSEFGVSTQMLGTSLANGNVGGGSLSPLYQVGGPRSIQLALKLTF